MQTDLSSRMEKLWAMSEIALRHGTVDYGLDGHCKTIRLSGMKFFYVNGALARMRAPKLDISVAQKSISENVIAFPGTLTVMNFAAGNDEILDRHFDELQMFNMTLSARKAA